MKFRKASSAEDQMPTVFRDHYGTKSVDWFPKCQMINRDAFLATLEGLFRRIAVTNERQKCCLSMKALAHTQPKQTTDVIARLWL